MSIISKITTRFVRTKSSEEVKTLNTQIIKNLLTFVEKQTETLYKLNITNFQGHSEILSNVRVACDNIQILENTYGKSC